MTYSSGDQPGSPGQPYQPPGQPYQRQYPQYPQQPYQPYPQQYGPGAPPRPRGRTPLWLALIFGVVGIVLIVVGGVIGFSQGLNKVNSFQRVSVADGIRTIHLDAGNYLAYYEAPNYNPSSGTVPVLVLQILDPQTGHLLTGSLYGGGANHRVKSLTYDYNGHHGAALYQFRVPHPGSYKVRVLRQPGSAAAPNADLAIGHSIATGLAIGGVLAIIGGLALVVALILLIVGLVLRIRSRKQVARPPGYGYTPPPQGNWPPPPQQ